MALTVALPPPQGRQAPPKKSDKKFPNNPLKRHMEATPDNLAALSHYLNQTLSLVTKERGEAEAMLRLAEEQAGFLIVLLRLVTLETTPPPIRYAAVLYFKNVVTRRWVGKAPDEDKLEPAITPIQESDKAPIKANIIGLMVSLPAALQSQLCEVISSISAHDFPSQWPSLFAELVGHISLDPSVNPTINHGVLLTAHSILKRWRSQTRSDEFYKEINEVLDVFAAPFLALFQKTDEIIRASSNNKASLQAQFTNLLLILKIYQSCITQDLAEFFAENIQNTMSLLLFYLKYSDAALAGEDCLYEVKAAIAEIMTLFVERYQSDLNPFLQSFLEAFWFVLTSAAAAAAADGDSVISHHHDSVISGSIEFIAKLARVQAYSAMFNSEETLQKIIVEIVLPNLMLRERDEELFEDDPMEFIRRDLEGSDSDTTRGAISGLLNALLENFAQQITVLFSGHITRFLTAYQSNPSAEWKSKDAALFLITALSARAKTSSLGATKVNEFLPIIEIFGGHIIPELASTSSHPILIVDALRYLTVFRSQLSKSQLLEVFPLILKHLSVTSNPVVITYAAVCMERILLMKTSETGTSLPLFNEADVAAFAAPVISCLFSLILQQKTDAKIAENEYMVKAIMRVVGVAKGSLLPSVEPILVSLKSILESISRNPSNPKFNHFVFETISLVVRSVCAGNLAIIASVEEYLFVCFSGILANRVAEFTPYVFQILSLLLQAQPGIPERYRQMFPSLMDAQLWTATGNIPALVKLMIEYLSKNEEFMASQLMPCLGVTQRLISSKKWDSYGFELLGSIMEKLPVSTLQPHVQSLFIMLLTRLFNSKTEFFTKEFVKFLCLLFILERPGLGIDDVIKTFDSIQSDPLFPSLLRSVVLTEMESVFPDLSRDRRVVEVGMIKLLTKSVIFGTSPIYVPIWPSVVEATINLIEAPAIASSKAYARTVLDEGTAGDVLGEAGEDPLEYNASFVALSSSKATRDPTAGYPDSRSFLKQALASLPPPRLTEMVVQAAGTGEVLRRYM